MQKIVLEGLDLVQGEKIVSIDDNINVGYIGVILVDDKTQMSSQREIECFERTISW